MLNRTVTTYPKHYVEVRAKYTCKCGHTFYRKNRDWFTCSPLNTIGYNSSRNRIREEQSKRVRECPMCNDKITPKII
jgi:hypothetical protein